MTLYKTVPVPDRGIDYQVKPHIIDPRAWSILAGFRTKNGTIRSFDGWNQITTEVMGEPILGLAEYFKPLTLETYRLALSFDRATHYTPTGFFELTAANTLAAYPYAPWSLVNFQGAIHIAALYTDGIHRWDGNDFLTKITGSPSFAFISTINNYLIGIYERVGDEHYPFSVRWAAEGTNDQWIATETVDAGEFPLSDTPDKGVALHRLGNDLVAYKERTIVPITFIGGNEVFGRRAAVAGVGLLGPYALVAAGDRHIFMSRETFYSYAGGNQVDDSIGDPVRDLVYEDINPALSAQVRAIYLRSKLEAVWFYPSKANATGLGCDKAVIYNLKDGTWAGPMKILDYITFASNFTDSDPTKRDVLGTLSGRVMGVGSSFTENGTVQLRTMESGDHNLQTDATDSEGAKIFFPLSTVFQVNVVNLDLEAVAGETAARIFVGSRLDLNDPISWQGPITVTANALQSIPIPVRRTGRWFRIKIECDASSEFALLGYQFEFERVGNR